MYTRLCLDLENFPRVTGNVIDDARSWNFCLTGVTITPERAAKVCTKHRKCSSSDSISFSTNVEIGRTEEGLDLRES